MKRAALALVTLLLVSCGPSASEPRQPSPAEVEPLELGTGWDLSTEEIRREP